MYIKKNGYVAGAVLSINLVRQMRRQLEFEKFAARCMVDNDITQEFKSKTENHPDQIYNFRYNHPKAIELTAEGKNANTTKST